MKRKNFIHLRKKPLFSEEESGVKFNQLFLTENTPTPTNLRVNHKIN
jgi:hypothetical protein